MKLGVSVGQVIIQLGASRIRLEYKKKRESNGSCAIYPRTDGATENSLGAFVYDCPIKFQGQWFDEESDLCYNRNRFYDTLTGQYCSSDPISLKGSNRLHGYVENPNRWVDPLGLSKSFAMGLGDHLDQFAEKVGAKTYKDFPKDDWRQIVIEHLNDPNAKNHFNLDGVDDVWKSISRDAAGKGGATDWELSQIYQNPGANVQFYKDGVAVPNPFH